MKSTGRKPLTCARGWDVAMDHSSRDRNAGLGAVLRLTTCCPQKEEIKMRPTKAFHVQQCKRTKEIGGEESEASFPITAV